MIEICHPGVYGPPQAAWPQQSPSWAPNGAQTPMYAPPVANYGTANPAQPSYGAQPDLSQQFSSMSVGSASSSQAANQASAAFGQAPAVYPPQPAGGGYDSLGSYAPNAGSYTPAAGSYVGYQSIPGGYNSSAGQVNASVPAGWYDQGSMYPDSTSTAPADYAGSYGTSTQSSQQPPQSGYPHSGYNTSSTSSAAYYPPPPAVHTTQSTTAGEWQQPVCLSDLIVQVCVKAVIEVASTDTMDVQMGQWNTAQQGGIPGGPSGSAQQMYQQPNFNR